MLKTELVETAREKKMLLVGAALLLPTARASPMQDAVNIYQENSSLLSTLFFHFASAYIRPGNCGTSGGSKKSEAGGCGMKNRGGGGGLGY